jgi:hypothetical protein
MGYINHKFILEWVILIINGPEPPTNQADADIYSGVGIADWYLHYPSPTPRELRSRGAYLECNSPIFYIPFTFTCT